MQQSYVLKPLFGLIIFFLLASAINITAQEKTLYKRIGGYDAIAAVTDQFIPKLVADKQLSRFFAGASDNSKMRIRQLVVDQLCAASGGPCIYTGRDMKSSHKGLGITESDWNIAAKLFAETLDQFKVPEKEKIELVNAIASFKNDIVEKMEASK